MHLHSATFKSCPQTGQSPLQSSLQRIFAGKESSKSETANSFTSSVSFGQTTYSSSELVLFTSICSKSSSYSRSNSLRHLSQRWRKVKRILQLSVTTPARFTALPLSDTGVKNVPTPLYIPNSSKGISRKYLFSRPLCRRAALASVTHYTSEYHKSLYFIGYGLSIYFENFCRFNPQPTVLLQIFLYAVGKILVILRYGEDNFNVSCNLVDFFKQVCKFLIISSADL